MLSSVDLLPAEKKTREGSSSKQYDKEKEVLMYYSTFFVFVRSTFFSPPCPLIKVKTDLDSA